jgi:hypothetical protein
MHSGSNQIGTWSPIQETRNSNTDSPSVLTTNLPSSMCLIFHFVHFAVSIRVGVWMCVSVGLYIGVGILIGVWICSNVGLCDGFWSGFDSAICISNHIVLIILVYPPPQNLVVMKWKYKYLMLWIPLQLHLQHICIYDQLQQIKSHISTWCWCVCQLHTTFFLGATERRFRDCLRRDFFCFLDRFGCLRRDCMGESTIFFYYAVCFLFSSYSYHIFTISSIKIPTIHEHIHIHIHTQAHTYNQNERLPNLHPTVRTHLLR